MIPVEHFISAVNSICSEKPSFKSGHDGSDGYCDAMGLIRGALFRSGVTGIRDMKESNQFVRKIVKKLSGIDSLKEGDIVLKVNNEQALPMKFRKGGSDFTGDENNYVDVGVVINDNPIKIVSMSKRGIKKSKACSWDYSCWLPYITKKGTNEMGNAVISGDNVKLYASASFGCKEYFEVPDGAVVDVLEKNDQWSFVSYEGNEAYVLSRHLKDMPQKPRGILLSDLEELEKAYEVIGAFLSKVKDATPEKKRKRRFFR